MAKKCINCQSLIDSDALFCPECGTKQPDIEANAPTRYLSSEYEVCQMDEDTLLFNIKGVPFKLKFIKGGFWNKIVELSDFYIGETVVTQALWATVMGSNPSENNDNLDYPVTNITLGMAKKFLARLKRITGVLFDIPTYAQFQYVFTVGADGMTDDECEETYWDDEKLHPVCGMMPNKLGIYDLSDLFEIVKDWFESTDDNPKFTYGFNPCYELSKDDDMCYAKCALGMFPLFLQDVRLDLVTLRIVLNIPVDPKIMEFKEKRVQQLNNGKKHKKNNK